VLVVSRVISLASGSYSFAVQAASPDTGVALLAEKWRALSAWLFDPYRPELHYMRGPGPKWREKHARADQANRRIFPTR
jgi:hypothetical protein